MSNLLKKEKGFTLIEIVLVLAIAGLLLVIVFLAVQGAQRSRRDTQRKNDASRMVASIESCAGNNDGQYANCTSATGTNGLITPTSGVGYFNPARTVGTSTNYALVAGAPTKDQMRIQTGAAVTCPGSSVAHTVIVSVGQESGQPYCVGN